MTAGIEEVRFIRFEDVYLGGFDFFGEPVWVPRDEAVPYTKRSIAHVACRQARRAEGRKRGEVVVVRCTPHATDTKEKR